MVRNHCAASSPGQRLHDTHQRFTTVTHRDDKRLTGFEEKSEGRWRGIQGAIFALPLLHQPLHTDSARSSRERYTKRFEYRDITRATSSTSPNEPIRYRIMSEEAPQTVDFAQNIGAAQDTGAASSPKPTRGTETASKAQPDDDAMSILTVVNVRKDPEAHAIKVECESRSLRILTNAVYTI
jgi:hypothetical protein